MKIYCACEVKRSIVHTFPTSRCSALFRALPPIQSAVRTVWQTSPRLRLTTRPCPLPTPPCCHTRSGLSPTNCNARRARKKIRHTAFCSMPDFPRRRHFTAADRLIIYSALFSILRISLCFSDPHKISLSSEGAFRQANRTAFLRL